MSQVPGIVSDEIREERLRTCLGCTFAVKPPGMNESNMNQSKGILDWWFGIRCQVCKCGMRPKSLLEFAQCPRGYWKR